MTPIERRRQGYQVLVNNPGQINAIRFLQPTFRTFFHRENNFTKKLGFVDPN